MKKWLMSGLLLLLAAGIVRGDILSAVPNTFVNGTVIDANQMNANFQSIVSGVNANAATAGPNSNITSLTGLTTPLSYVEGGTSVYIGGTSAGTANAQTLASPTPIGFTLVSGKQINFIAGATNTSTTTLNVNSTGAIAIKKPSLSGPTVLTGGELTSGNSVVVIYDGTQYMLLTPSISDVVIPVGTSINFRGLNAPTGFLLEDGSAVSTTTYAALKAVITFTSVATTTTGSKVVTGLTSTATLAPGMPVGGTNVTCGDTIATVDSSTQITLTTNNASGTGSTTLTFAPYGVGNCSTTFNLPDSRGRLSAMVDNPLGTGAAGRITTTTCTNNSTPGVGCGLQTASIALANLPNISLDPSAATVAIHVRQISSLSGGGAATALDLLVAGAGGGVDSRTYTLNPTPLIPLGGSGTPTLNLPPVLMTLRAIKY